MFSFFISHIYTHTYIYTQSYIFMYDDTDIHIYIYIYISVILLLCHICCQYFLTGYYSLPFNLEQVFFNSQKIKLMTLIYLNKWLGFIKLHILCIILIKNIVYCFHLDKFKKLGQSSVCLRWIIRRTFSLSLLLNMYFIISHGQIQIHRKSIHLLKLKTFFLCIYVWVTLFIPEQLRLLNYSPGKTFTYFPRRGLSSFKSCSDGFWSRSFLNRASGKGRLAAFKLYRESPHSIPKR